MNSMTIYVRHFHNEPLLINVINGALPNQQSSTEFLNRQEHERLAQDVKTELVIK